MMTLLDVRALAASVEGNRLLGPLDLTLHRGQRRALLGPSGSGKSLTASAVMGTSAENLALEGRVLLEGADVLGVPLARRAASLPRIAFVSQDPARSLNPAVRVGAHLERALGAQRGPGGPGAAPAAGPGRTLSGSAARRTRSGPGSRRTPAGPSEAALRLLADLAFEDPRRVHRAYPHELSGGQRQRVCLGLALARRPDLLVADEPTTALDAATQAQVLALLDELLPESSALLFITHDAAAAAAVRADRLHLEGGRIVAHPDGPITAALPAAPSIPTAAPSTPRPQVRVSPAAPSPASPRRTSTAVPAASAPLLEARGASVVHPRRASRLLRRGPGERGPGDRGPLRALAEADLRVGAGESVGVVGNSGSGKTTLISVLLGLRAPDAGTALYDGRPLPALDRAGLLRFRREVQLIPQDARGSLDPRAGALRQVAEPLRRLAAPGGVSRGAARDEAARLLERVGLEADRWDRRPHQLSGGQCQRVAIARALATSPRLLVADEPLSGLDPELRQRTIELLRSVLADPRGAAATRRTGLLMVSHDLESVLALCDRAVVVDAGRIVEDRPVLELFRAPSSAAGARLLSTAAGKAAAHA